MAKRVKHNKGFSWEIFGEPAKLGDRMALGPSKSKSTGKTCAYYQYVDKVKIYGKEVEIKDKVLHITRCDGISTVAQMKESDDGVFIFLPKEGNEFYDDQNPQKIKLCLRVVGFFLSLISRQETKKK